MASGKVELQGSWNIKQVSEMLWEATRCTPSLSHLKPISQQIFRGILRTVWGPQTNENPTLILREKDLNGNVKKGKAGVGAHKEEPFLLRCSLSLSFCVHYVFEESRAEEDKEKGKSGASSFAPSGCWSRWVATLHWIIISWPLSCVTYQLQPGYDQTRPTTGLLLGNPGTTLCFEQKDTKERSQRQRVMGGWIPFNDRQWYVFFSW